MKQVRNSFLKSGYDQEEAYFHKVDQQLIEKQRRAQLTLVDNKVPNAPEKNTEEKKTTPETTSGPVYKKAA